MRAVFGIAAVFIAAAIAWALYIEHDAQKYRDSLSELPTVSTEKQVHLSEGTPDDGNGESFEAKIDGSLEDLTAVNTDSQENGEATDSLEIDELETSGHLKTDINQEIGDSEETLTFNELFKEEEVETQTVGPCGETCDPSRVDYFSLSAEEQIELTRQDFVERFGDIPEGHLYVEQLQLSQQGKTIPESEILKYVRAVATLFPNEANKKHLQEMEIRLASN